MAHNVEARASHKDNVATPHRMRVANCGKFETILRHNHNEDHYREHLTTTVKM